MIACTLVFAIYFSGVGSDSGIVVRQAVTQHLDARGLLHAQFVRQDVQKRSVSLSLHFNVFPLGRPSSSHFFMPPRKTSF